LSAEPLQIPHVRARRWLFFALVGVTTAAGSWVMARTVGAGGFTLLEAVILALFVPTFAWITVPFWTTVIGFVLRRGGIDALSLGRHARVVGRPTWSSTAIVVPVFNEDPSAVAVRLSALSRSLVAAGAHEHFHIHLLSDTSDPTIGAQEEVEWVRLQAEHPELPIHYRRRERNEGRKAGNIGEFCNRSADEYDFMIVLDADSLMTGGTAAELAGLMEANPDVGLIQTVPLPALQRTLFGRLVQFAACLYGPVLATGLSFWQAESANYWGHNAILRLRAFVDHCKLPVLPGRPPLGGEVLSHDFVEAALLRRAGWKVVLAPKFLGSWEEVPGNVVDYAKRDRRWAQGSLQHLRLIGLRGLHPLSRLYFGLGAMGYVSSLLWLLFLLAGTVYVLAPDLHGPELGLALGAPALNLSLLGGTAVILFLPKVLGLVDALFSARAGFGGVVRLTLGSSIETLFSILLAPIMMLYHARFVTGIALGRSVPWDTQHREGRRLGWREATRAGSVPMLAGLLWGGLTLSSSPLFFLWMSPIFVGLALAVPLLRWTSSPTLGEGAYRLGLFRVPSEAGAWPEVESVRRALRPGRLTDEPESGGTESRDPHPAVGVPTSAGKGGWSHFLTVGCVMYNAERGLFDLRQGRPLLVSGSRREVDERERPADCLLIAVEGLTSEHLDRLRSLGSMPTRLVVTRHRVAAMGLGPERGNGAQPGERAFELPNGTGLHRIVELSCAAAPMPGSGVLVPQPVVDAERAGLSLVRLGRLLPAVVSIPVRQPYAEELVSALADGALLRVSADEVDAFVASAGAEVVPISEAPVPLPEGAESRFILFREGHGLQEHVAILVGNEADWPDPVPVRLHSACLTGDLFGSLRCDCGEQLRGSMSLFASSGGGVLLYLAQEGRGIGLRNKFRAYTLQEGGLDTIDADSALGFGPDERRYDVAVRILQMIGVERIELLTNNPEKVRAMQEAGITVVNRRPLHGTLNRHNLPYVRAKVQRAGHWLGDMLSQPLSGD